MEMQVGCSGIPRVADTGEDLPPLNPVSDVYLDATRLEMRVQDKLSPERRIADAPGHRGTPKPALEICLQTNPRHV